MSEVGPSARVSSRVLASAASWLGDLGRVSPAPGASVVSFVKHRWCDEPSQGLRIEGENVHKGNL